MTEKIIFPENPIVGKYYQVPHVQNNLGEMIPINSYLHTDLKYIKFELPHWHIDWRFVSKELYRFFFDDFQLKRTNHSYEQLRTVICLINEEMNDKYYWDKRKTTFDKQVHYKKVKYKRLYAISSFEKDNPEQMKQWPKNLREAFCKSKLKKVGNHLICPHKGMLIDRNCKDENGNYVCPGHLLKFDPFTLKAI